MRASDIIRTAASYIGVKENPPGSNNVVFNTEYYGREVFGASTYPWCCAFVWYVFHKAGAAELFFGGDKTAYCPALALHARASGLWITGNYQPGDLVLFNWSGKKNYDGSLEEEHIGIVESVREDGTVIAIEGNTSITSNDNGGSVMRRERSPENIVGAVRPLYESEDEDMLEYEDFKSYMKKYEDEKADEAASNWGDEADLARVWAKENGILVGDTQGRPQYKAACTREMMVLFMYRLYGLIKKLVGK